ncbi:hypothetical protein [Candidatus Chloroploca asiatica]|nr:hypothetical protein [Candidatus Chloroploca asiatica]
MPRHWDQGNDPDPGLHLEAHMHPPSSNAALIALIEAIPAQPIDAANPLTTLRPLISGTLTFAHALEPAIQEALDACASIAYRQHLPGRILCDRLHNVRPIPASSDVVGW